eukprot:2014590-Rhodomonas_salina.1
MRCFYALLICAAYMRCSFVLLLCAASMRKRPGAIQARARIEPRHACASPEHTSARADHNPTDTHHSHDRAPPLQTPPSCLPRFN